MVRRSLLLLLAVLAAASVAFAGTLHAQELSLPFRVGESLEYEVRVSRFGKVGSGRMWIEGPEPERGVSTWRMRFELSARVGPVRGVDKTSSWFDPIRFATTKFVKEERHPLSRSKESVEIHRDSGTWTDEERRGAVHELAASRPLDELSFLYFLRTLPTDRDTVMSFDRHFDKSRNPTIVRVMGRDTITTPGGIFRTRVIEMEVRDPKHYKGTGKIRVHLNDGDCRMPVRIDSRMPVLGATTLLLKKWSHPPGYPETIIC